MRRFSIPAALCVSALCAWLAAPALSLQPYSEGAVDFESELPVPERIAGASAAHASSADHLHEDARWISPPVTAEHRFDVLGIAGEMRPVEIRVRDTDGAWSEWVETHGGDPVYVGGADEAQVRAQFRPEGELHFVNVSGTADGFVGGLINDARRSINSAFISAASGFIAEAAAKKPKMVSRAAWGATQEEGGCAPRGPAEYGEVRSAVIHHTVNENTYTKAEAAGIVLGICRFHVNGNGWNDIGYQALVDRFGRVYKGRAGGMGAAVVGAQAQGFNSQTTAIASIGTNSTVKLNRKARAGVSKYLAWKLSIHGAVPATGTVELTSAGGSASRYPAGRTIVTGHIVGHRDLGLTECPGDKLWLQLPAIRKAVQKRIKG